MKKRIIGIDVARALAVIGMIIVNFKVVFGEVGDGWLKSFAHLFDGKAAATFVVLAGVGLALMTNSAIKNGQEEKLKAARKRILKRALFLFIIGLSYIWIWPADILHFYGIYMLLTLLFITQSSNRILVGVIGICLMFPVLLSIWNYEIGWDFTTLTYTDFWTFKGFVRNLFYNGFHPVIPWSAFMLYGLWYGKQDLNDNKFVLKSFRIGLIVFLAVQLFSFILLQILIQEDITLIDQLNPILGTDPMPPMPLYMINGMSIATVVISACIILAKRYEGSKIIDALNKTGQLALTFYVAHVVIGMGIVDEFGDNEFGEYSITFSVSYAVVFSLACIIFAIVWMKYKKSGPLEWVMRKLTD